jgi:hypothetical protein
LWESLDAEAKLLSVPFVPEERPPPVKKADHHRHRREWNSD